MCGRYALYGPQSSYREHFGVPEWPDFPERYNIAPSTWVPVIRQAPDGQQVANLLRWGLIPHWARDPLIGNKLSNARGESLDEKPSFRDSYRRRRCLIPASGFFEWKTEGKTKLPYFIHRKSDAPMAMAGLWESWTSHEGEIVRTFCVITTTPNALMALIHDRMPVIITPEHYREWLDPTVPGDELSSLIGPYPSADMEAWPVSRAVSRSSNEGPELVEPMTATIE